MRDLLRRHILDPTFDDWLGTHHFGSAGDTPEEWTTDPDQRAQALSLPTDVGETPAVPLVLVTPALGVVKSVNRGTRFAHLLFASICQVCFFSGRENRPKNRAHLFHQPAAARRC